MKSKFLFLATLVAVLFTAQTPATASVPSFSADNVSFSTKDKTFKVSIRNMAAETVSIYLEDIQGIVLVNETLETAPNFVKAYRLENLPIGKYQFTVKRNGYKVVQPFDITLSSINLSETDKIQTLLPSILQKEDKITVKSFAKKGDKTTVRILSNDGALLLEKEYTDEILCKTFDLSSLPKGIYFFEVATDEQEEYFTVVH
ncbi:MAG: T9SS type A sorting domain-containing protein [Saprospiraceae bacterium]|nr:T9SS type A sorting domain-containing protein [Saprospiraceae bacterium]